MCTCTDLLNIGWDADQGCMILYLAKDVPCALARGMPGVYLY